MRWKMKARFFRRNIREYGIRYAVLWYLELPYSFDGSENSMLRKVSDWAYDWCNQRCQKCLDPTDRKQFAPEFTEYLPLPEDDLDNIRLTKKPSGM